MKIAVLNGSPKGEQSVTMQYVALLRKQFPEHEFNIYSVAQRSQQLEQDQTAFAEVLAGVRTADAVLWAFPLYVLLVAAQYKRFIELVFERGAQEAFAGKYAAALSTSIKFFDYTAHNYIHAVAEDMGMKFFGGFSAAMDDLFFAERRENLRQFAQQFLETVRLAKPAIPAYPRLQTVVADYDFVPPAETIACETKRVAIVTDAGVGDEGLRRMVERFAAGLSGQVTTFNLWDVDIKGGCLGCCRCGYDNHCCYEGKDGYAEFHQQLRTYDVLVFAGTIRDRYLSARWKMFFDRGFYRNHMPAYGGRQIAFIISGPLGQNANLQQILSAYGRLQQANVAGMVSDDGKSAAELAAQLDELARRTVAFAENGYIQPESYLQVGGHKIFRDAIWSRLGFPFVADYKYYSEHGLFDFPHWHDRERIQSVLLRWAVAGFPALRRRIYQEATSHMIKPFQKVLATL